MARGTGAATEAATECRSRCRAAGFLEDFSLYCSFDTLSIFQKDFISIHLIAVNNCYSMELNRCMGSCTGDAAKFSFLFFLRCQQECKNLL
jgi:hypothetical protein